MFGTKHKMKAASNDRANTIGAGNSSSIQSKRGRAGKNATNILYDHDQKKSKQSKT